MRPLVVGLIVLLPLAAFLAFAAGDGLVPYPWSKQAHAPGAPSHGAPRVAVKLPSGVTPAAPVIGVLPLLGLLAATESSAAVSSIPAPPFVPPRA